MKRFLDILAYIITAGVTLTALYMAFQEWTKLAILVFIGIVFCWAVERTIENLTSTKTKRVKK